MDTQRSSRIRDAFGAAAEEYDRHAGVQRLVAGTLAGLIANQPLPAQPRILEIGCGTGYLTRCLRASFPAAEIVATDLCSEMVARVAADPSIAAQAHVMDGEHPDYDGPWFDMIASSLAFQWFDDMPAAIARLYALLRPGGTLMFATMAERSFGEWRAAHALHGTEPGTPRYPSADALRSMLAHHADAFLFEEDYVQDFGGAIGLHRHLKGIGATVPVEGRTPLSPAIVRRIMCSFDEAGGRVTYHVAYCRVTRPA